MLEDPLVSVLCTSYNHRPYIAQCLDGILNQQTKYPFEIVIHDDASTDGTAEVIRDYVRKYPEIVKPILQSENQYSKDEKGIIGKFMLPLMHGKYISICEGDDFWIDKKKLDRQITILEDNSKIGMCYTRSKK